MPRYAVWLLVFVFVIYAFIWPVLAGFEKYCMSQTERYGGHKDGICGDELSLVVTLVCEGKFSLPKKRSVDHKNSNKGKYFKDCLFAEIMLISYLFYLV